jgi:cytoskeletal protein CcmA (bactofilin family)
MFSKLKGKSQDAAADSPLAQAFNVPAFPGTEPPRDTPRSKTQTTSLPGVLSATQKPAIVSEQFTIRGDIDSDGTLHVEGRVIGVVKAHTIHVSATGHIEGDVVCDNLTIKGQVDGKIACQDLTIAASARVKGRVDYRFITIGSGARVDCEMSIQTDKGQA